MPIDWDKIDAEIAVREKATGDAMARKVASLSALSAEETKALLPKQGDVKAFAQLMSRVEQQGNDAANAAWLAQNIQQLAPILLRVVKLLI